MSLFKTCDVCTEAAAAACVCQSPACFLCDKHISIHIKSGGWHSIQDTAVDISALEASNFKAAIDSSKVQSISQAVSKRNSIVGKCLELMKNTEQECSIFIECVLRETEMILREIWSRKSIPLYTEHSFVLALVSLKESGELSEESILREALSFFLSLNSSLMDLSKFKIYSESVDEKMSKQQESYNDLLKKYNNLKETHKKEIAKYQMDYDTLLRKFNEQKIKYQREISVQQEDIEGLVEENEAQYGNFTNERTKHPKANRDLLRKLKKQEEQFKREISKHKRNYDLLLQQKKELDKIILRNSSKYQKEVDILRTRVQEQEAKYQQELAKQQNDDTFFTDIEIDKIIQEEKSKYQQEHKDKRKIQNDEEDYYGLFQESQELSQNSPRKVVEYQKEIDNSFKRLRRKEKLQAKSLLKYFKRNQDKKSFINPLKALC